MTGTVMLPSNVTVAIDIAGGTSFAELLGVTAFDPGADSLEERDNSSFDNADDYRTYADGMKDRGQTTITYNYINDNALHESLRALAVGTTIAIRTTQGSDTRTFSAKLLSNPHPVTIGELAPITMTLRRTTAFTFGAAA